MKTATTKTAPLFLRKFGPLLGAIAFYALIMIRAARILSTATICRSCCSRASTS